MNSRSEKYKTMLIKESKKLDMQDNAQNDDFAFINGDER